LKYNKSLDKNLFTIVGGNLDAYEALSTAIRKVKAADKLKF